MKKICCFLLCFLILLCITSCNEDIDKSGFDEEISNEKNQNNQFGKNDFTSIVLTTSEKIVYNKINEKGELEFLVKDIKTEKVSECGRVKNFMICNNSSLLIDHWLYFFVTISDDGQKMTNVFYRLDIDNYVLEELYQEDNMQTFFYLSGDKSDIYVAKGKLVDEKTGYTYIERFNVETCKKEEVLGYKIDYESGEGRVITNLSFNEGKLYLVEEIVKEGVSTSVINVYDEDGMHIKTIDMSKYKDEIFCTAIAQIYVNDKYIFITNFADKSLVGYVDNEQFVEVETKENFYIAQNSLHSYENPIFYIRETKKLYFLDKEQNKLIEKDISYEWDNFYISYVSQDNVDGIWVYLINEENSELSKFIYYEKQEILETLKT
ncbi:MAG: hypothetical protein E7266_09060 [Lachnospiraceae bacterium]|nr:hypothetical protein [Lachnospiraceae bacterium]